MDLAAALCAARRVRLTPLRRAVLGLLLDADRPLSAYQMLEMLNRRRNRKPGPPTIYRALAFLREQGLCIRLECRNAYVASAHPAKARGAIVFICDSCNAAMQVESDLVASLIDADAASLGFRIGYRVLEMQGTCTHCRHPDEAGKVSGS